MKQLRIACGQFETAPGDRDANIGSMSSIAESAAEDGCDLIVFPEMAVTGYLEASELARLAEHIDGDAAAALSRVAIEYRIAIAYGFPEVVEGKEKRADSFLVFDRNGNKIAHYRKMHLFGHEPEWCEAGSEVPLFRFEDFTMSGWICYDTRFPELARMSALAGAELCIVPAAWFGPPSEWELAIRARALDNSCFVAGADLINRADGLVCRGLSMVAGPHGEVLAQAEPGNQGFVATTIDTEEIHRQRARIPLKRDRLPHLYRPIVSKES